MNKWQFNRNPNRVMLVWTYPAHIQDWARRLSNYWVANAVYPDNDLVWC